MIKKIILIFQLLGISTSAWSGNMPDALKYSVEVIFIKIHDPEYIVLKLPNGKIIDTTYNGIEFDTLYDWEMRQKTAGDSRRLQLSYTNEKGVMVQDKATGIMFNLNGVMKAHPIDLATEEYAKKYNSTVGIKQTKALALKAWEAELNRAYEYLGGNKNPELAQAQLAWTKFRDTQIGYLQSEYGKRSGTIHGIIYMNHVVNLTKNRANSLKGISEW